MPRPPGDVPVAEVFSARSVVRAGLSRRAALLGPVATLLVAACATPEPPRPVAAVPPPLPPWDYTGLVLFDVDSATLDARAREIVAAAARGFDGLGRARGSRLLVRGHADRSGSPEHNLALSGRRVEAVAAELARLGVPPERVAVEAHGEAMPLLPTPDGVPDRHNRRVGIVSR